VTRRAATVIVVLTWAFGGGAPTAAQGQNAAPGAQEPAATFKSGVEAVTVSALVRDRRGKVVKDLKQSDFQVLDSGRPSAISDFYTGHANVSLAVLLDISGSMAVGGNMDRGREAVNVALSNLMADRDEAALFTFDSALQEVHTFTNQLHRISSISLEGKPWGTTSLYDAIAKTAERVAERSNRHRAVLVITDGVDTGSRMTPPQVSYVASKIDVPVYLLVVSNPVDNPNHKLAVMEVTGDHQHPNSATLADLARWTGGDMALSSELEDATKALGDLMGNLRHQYLISFEPGTRPGWHPLEIRTRKKNLIVHARSGYMAGAARTGR
jgi:Ca-activated chloride channel homolog